ncbi:putative RNA methyltransferase [Agromyces seonyuensis]|uniref:Methyltransferase domain-containing protein n=1 Tax=Agromyces seonyuensis TaxID=2662446 RepID=A0A6I4P594_9MICO|nr:methyltransferase domain-containing protein [Agromyces seonyuensis]MWC00186.1 methyltransferase domain-containing protein [Agromyces seonyuensis]
MSISEISEWVRCPNCFHDLEVVASRTLGCANGHRFDLHKHGYATLLPPRSPAHQGDSREMLVARDAVLESGLYAPIADAVAALARASLREHEDAPPRLVDFGCGTGHYARAVATAAPHTPELLFTDRSPAAVRWSTLATPGAGGVVLDVWAPLPLRDGIADVALDVFAPRNPPEFARVLRPGGTLVVVVPRPGHLAELRVEGAMLDVPEGKADAVHAQFAPFLEPAGLERVTAPIALTPAQADAVRGMGPAGHHADRARAAGDLIAEPTVSATLDVDVLAYRRPAAGESAQHG